MMPSRGQRAILDEVRARLEALARMTRAAEAEYVLCDDKRLVVRHRDVAAAVCRRLGMEVSTRMMGDLRSALRRAGWRHWRLKNRALWVGVRPRDVPMDEALDISWDTTETIRRGDGDM